MINIGIVAHVDAGKTTITEQMLYTCGVIKTPGRVDNGNTITDDDLLEKQRGITIKASTVSMNWKECKINLLDTPGHMDFIAEVERSLEVLDIAILAISAKEGIQPQTKVIYNALKRCNIPTVLFINKVDRMGVVLSELYNTIKEELSDALYFINDITDQGTRDAAVVDELMNIEMIENNQDTIALLDDQILMSVLEGNPIEQTERIDSARKLFLSCKLIPLLHGSALLGTGIEPLLNLVVTWGKSIQQSCLSARVYKVDRDMHGARRCYTRIFGGELELREVYPIHSKETTFKILKMAIFCGVKPVVTNKVTAGDIAIIYSDKLEIEDIIGEPPEDRKRYSIAVPTLKARVIDNDLGMRKAICEALIQFTDEDPFLEFSIHPFTEAIEIKIFGVVQKEIIEMQLKERFGIETQIQNPDTIYKERPSESSTVCRYMYKDGNHYAATVGLKVEPLPVGSGIVYETLVSYGDLKKPFQNAVREGAEFGLREGLKGWSLTDVKVSFIYSEFNSVDSTPADFRKLAEEVVKLAIIESGTECLEPILDFELTVPQYAIGRAMSDVLKMRGEVNEPIVIKEMVLLTGKIPVDTSKAYESELADYTGGKGVLVTHFSGYKLIDKKCN